MEALWGRLVGRTLRVNWSQIGLMSPDRLPRRGNGARQSSVVGVPHELLLRNYVVHDAGHVFSRAGGRMLLMG